MRSSRSKTRDVVPGARELLRGREPGGPRADDRDALARPRARRRLRHERPARTTWSAIVRSMVLMVTGSSRMLRTHDASHGAGHTRPGDLGEVVRLVRGARAASSMLPAVDEVVPLGDEVPERAALVAERDAAVHAARRLRARPLLGRAARTISRQSRDALLDRALVLLRARDLQEALRITHDSRPPSLRLRSALLEYAPPLVRHHLHEPALAPTSRARACPCALRVCAHVLLDERADDLLVLGASSGSSSTIAWLHARRERAVVVEHVGDAAAHAGARSCGPSARGRRPCRPSCTRSRDRRRPRRPRSAPLLRTANRSPARPAKNALPARRAVEARVADDDVLVRLEASRAPAAAPRARRPRGPCRRSRSRRPRARASIPRVANAPKLWPAVPVASTTIVSVGQPVGAVLARDLAREPRAEGAVGVRERDLHRASARRT